MTKWNKDARRARSAAGALNLLGIVLMAVVFYALTNDPIRAIIGVLAFGLYGTTARWASDYMRAADVYEAQGWKAAEK